MSADAVRYLAIGNDGVRHYIALEWPSREARTIEALSWIVRQYERHTDPDGFIWYREIEQKKETDSANSK